MSHNTAAARLYYFDVLGGFVALLIVVRVVVLTLGPSSTWDAWTVTATGAFAFTLIALIAFRSRAYTQAIPWLAGSFSVAAMLATAVLFWPLHLVWYAAAMATGGSVLAFAQVLRTKPQSAGISRYDVFKLTALAIGIFLGLAAVEVGLRLAPGIFGGQVRQLLTADPRQYGVPHPYIGYLHRPNGTSIVSSKDFYAVHKVDAAGFRNAWPWPSQPEIAVVGDSVTFGYGVTSDEAWPTIVGKALPRHPLVNLALIGAGPQQYLRVYETFGTKLHPKLLVVGIFAANDFWDAEMFDLWLKSGFGGNYMVWRDFGRPGPFTLSISDPAGSLKGLFNRYIYPALRGSYVYNLARALRGGKDGELSAPPQVFVLEDGGRLQLLGDDFRDRSSMGLRSHHPFELTVEALLRIHALASEQGTHVLMVLQPSKEEVYLPLIQRDVPDLTRDLRAAFDEHGVSYLDLLAGFRQRAAAGDLLFFEIDGHPNARGYALTAQLLLAHLRENASRYGLGDATQIPMGDASGR
jgi:hypothetical protein